MSARSGVWNERPPGIIRALPMTRLNELVTRIRACRLCEAELPNAPRPVLQVSASARILVAGQAPGRLVHLSGVPFDDPSGDRLREWMGIDREVFYDAGRIAIVPMAFCYPGTGPNGDLPPPPRCAATWHGALRPKLRKLGLTLVIGLHAQRHWLGEQAEDTLTATVAAWERFGPAVLPLPHPSPRNNRWFQHNPWFERDVVPEVRRRVAAQLAVSD